jgi:hypothetical protein
MKWLRKLPDIIAIFLSCLSIAGLYLAFRWVNSQLDDTIPNMDYQTIFLKDTFDIKEPDIKIKWLEHIREVEAKPETVKVVRYVYNTPDILVNFIKADGNKIRIRTQENNSPFGQELVYPYYKYFQFVPPENMTYYRDFWDWEKLFISVTCYREQQTEIKLGSSLQFNPWALRIEPFISNKRTGIEIRKQLW